MRLQNYKIGKTYGDIETHEVFLDTLAHAKEEELDLSEKKFEVAITPKTILAIFTLFFLCAGALFSRAAYWQIVEGNNLRALAERNKSSVALIRPERGIIYDKSFTQLVANAPAYDLVCKSDGKEPEVEQNLNQERLLVLEARISEMPDCYIEKNTLRNYAMGTMFSHVLGYNGRINAAELKSAKNYAVNDYIGKSGLEKYYETALRGTPGSKQHARIVLGATQEENILSNPKEGHNLVLNIDANLQKVTYEALEKSIKNIGAKKGAAVALDPRNGAVLAMVSYPAYNNNIFSQGISQRDFDALNRNPNQPFFNRAIAAQYPTGSTIKPFLAAGALQEKLISSTKLINDPGYILVHSQNDPSVTYKFAGVVPHGLVDMRKALAVSSNIYFFTVGGGYGNQQGLGPGRIKKYLDLFGWEEKTGVDLPGEFRGFVPTPSWKKEAKDEPWWDGDTYNLSIGQSDLQVTPLQVAAAYAAIANEGTIYKPRVVQKIISGSGEGAAVVQEFAPEVVNSNFIEAENLKIIREGMRDCVAKEYGSCTMLNDVPVNLAAKTGTAETGKKGYFNTWASAFAPYENPEIVFVTTIEGVNGLRAATLPVANEVLYWYFTHK